MNFAVDLIMAGIFFRLCNISLEKVDLFPDLFGMLFILFAIFLLRKGEDDFREARLPCLFALLFSAWNLYNFMPTEPNGGFALLYAVLEGALLLSECVLYLKLFDGFGSLYGVICVAGKRCILLYALSRAAGIGLTLAVWLKGADSLWLTAGYLIWVLLNVVITTRLIYEFYILKPKFHKK